MEARAFIRVSVGGLGLRIPVASRAAGAGVHSASSPCYCEVRLPNFPAQTAALPLLAPGAQDPDSHNVAASFHLDEPALKKLLSGGRCMPAARFLEVVVFTGRQGSCCGVSQGKQLGLFRVPIDRDWAAGKPQQLHSGWVSIGKGKAQGGRPGAELHLVVRVEPDPRYVFQFDGAASLNPKIVQAEGNSRQPIFNCKFSRSGLGQNDPSTPSGWAAALNGGKEKERKERKGWLVMIHDLSGAPLAAASMVTPFVPSAGTDRVSKSNPGAWVILRPDMPGVDSWRPWGQLEAWRERNGKGGVGCRFQLMGDGGGVAGLSNGIVIAETVLSKQHGGEFVIDTSKLRSEAPTPSSSRSPDESPKSSGDYSFVTLGLQAPGGFVMSCSVKGEAQRKRSKPVVQLAMQHASSVEDAAVFMALAAAVDLSVDACQPFSRKLKKELANLDYR